MKQMHEIEQATKYFITIIESDKVGITNGTLTQEDYECIEMIGIALKAFTGRKISKKERTKAIKFFKATITFATLEIMNSVEEMQDDKQIELLEMCEIALMALEEYEDK